MATALELPKHLRKRLMRHMGLHYDNHAWQYAAWAKHALKVELTTQDCSELFMEGLHSQEIDFE